MPLSRHIFPLVVLAALVVLVFGQTLRFDYVGFDDPEYVTGNPLIRDGLTWQGVRTVFTEGHFGNWHPLTSLTLMLDCQLAGLNPAMAHATNILIHLLNTCLLYWLFLRLTGEAGASWLIAALFAIHPFHVQSVAWVSSRKDLLSAFFGFGALLLYDRYARKPDWRAYLLTWMCVVFALMSKATMVVLPCLMLILDYWPLCRIDNKQDGVFRRLLWCAVEKIPMLMTAAAVTWITYLLQQRTGFTEGLPGVPFAHRLINALVAYTIYLAKTCVPLHFAMFYPYPHSYPPSLLLASAVLMIAMTLLALRCTRSHPFLLMGWLWFTVSLIPMIGLLQVGDQAYADRYTYTSLVGVFLLVVWSAKEAAIRYSWTKHLQIAATVWVLALALIAAHETTLWRDSLTLFSRAVQVTRDNYVAEFNLGNTYLERKDYAEAERHLSNAIHAKPDFPDPIANLGVLKIAQGKTEEAVALYQDVLTRFPKFLYRGRTLGNLGAAYVQLNQWDAAETALREALQSETDDARLFYFHGVALAKQGKEKEAIDAFNAACAINPPYARAAYELGKVALRQQRFPEAAARFAQYLASFPGDANAHVDAGVALGMLGNVAAAIPHFQEAIRLNPNNADAHFNLGMAFVALQRTEDAAREFQETLRIRPADAQANRQLEALRKP